MRSRTAHAKRAAHKTSTKFRAKDIRDETLLSPAPCRWGSQQHSLKASISLAHGNRLSSSYCFFRRKTTDRIHVCVWREGTRSQREDVAHIVLFFLRVPAKRFRTRYFKSASAKRGSAPRLVSDSLSSLFVLRHSGITKRHAGCLALFEDSSTAVAHVR